MADQNDLTFGGVGADPTGAYTPYDSGWTVTYNDGAQVWKPNATGIIADPGAVAADETDIYYTNEFVIVGSDIVGGQLYYPASGEAEITM